MGGRRASLSHAGPTQHWRSRGKKQLADEALDVVVAKVGEAGDARIGQHAEDTSVHAQGCMTPRMSDGPISRLSRQFFGDPRHLPFQPIAAGRVDRRRRVPCPLGAVPLPAATIPATGGRPGSDPRSA